jgi:hypothetical protein
LLELFNGGSIDAGYARFSDWQLTSLDDTAPPNPDLSLVAVTPLVNDPANPGLQFAANGQLATAAVSAIDLAFTYRVQAIGGGASFAGHSLSMAGVTFGGDGGIAYISQEAVDQFGGDLGPALAIADHEIDFFQFDAAAVHAPHFAVTVHVDVFLTGLAANDSINLTSFTQRFAQTGPIAVPGDFNQDKRVDGADFLVWHRGQSSSPLSAQDLADWRTHFGETIASTASIRAVPEPAARVLLLCGAATVLGRLRLARLESF